MDKVGNKKRQDLAVYQKYLLAFYVHVTGELAESISDIPDDKIEFLSALEYSTLIRPFVVKSLREGMSMGECANKYRVTKNVIRGIGRKVGHNS